MRAGRRAAVVAISAAVVLVTGCGGSGATAKHPIGDAGIGAVRVVAKADTPLDAAPSPDGTDTYYLATGDNGPGVYRVPGGGGPVSTVTQGAPLTKPTGIGVAPDGLRLYLADAQAQSPAAPGAAGAILTVSAMGTPEPLTTLPGTRGRSPHGLDVGSDVIYFTGIDPANNQPGLFQVPLAGGTVSTIAEGPPFSAPDSVAATAGGVAYVTDQGAGPGQGKVFRVSGGSVTPVLSDLRLGGVAGVSLINNDATLLVSSSTRPPGRTRSCFWTWPQARPLLPPKSSGSTRTVLAGSPGAARPPPWPGLTVPLRRYRLPDRFQIGLNPRPGRSDQSPGRHYRSRALRRIRNRLDEPARPRQGTCGRLRRSGFQVKRSIGLPADVMVPATR